MSSLFQKKKKFADPGERKGLEGCRPAGASRPAEGGAGARKRGAPESPVPGEAGDAPKFRIEMWNCFSPDCLLFIIRG
jgi:hypothetical protein